MNQKASSDGAAALFLIIIVVGAIVGSALVWPHYNVYSKEMKGKAALAEAEFSKKITIEEAKAELESAQLKKQTEIIRAEGIAEANRIIADSITPAYIQYKFVEGLNDGNTEVIYVPTEANIPIMEAGRLRNT